MSLIKSIATSGGNDPRVDALVSDTQALATGLATANQRIDNFPDRFKGRYTTEAALTAAHPTAVSGCYAYVDAGAGADIYAMIWDETDSKWTREEGASTAETPQTIKDKYESIANAFTDKHKSVIENSALSPAGVGNTSRFVQQEIDGHNYVAWANEGSTSDQLEILLDNAGSENIFNLANTELPWNPLMAFHYRTGMVIYIETENGIRKFGVRAGATLEQLMKNPTDPAVADADSGYEPLGAF